MWLGTDIDGKQREVYWMKGREKNGRMMEGVRDGPKEEGD